MRGILTSKKSRGSWGSYAALGVDIKHVNYQMIVSNRKITVEKTGIVLT